MSTLETVDIPGIDILAVGGPYFGVGSAKGGDYYTLADLKRFAQNARELSGEVHMPIKLGHSKEQRLLRESGLLDEHGAPAAGWLENLRVDGTKLLADAKRVPKKLEQLMRAGAFRTRSVEQRNYTGQREANRGKSYGWVIDGLALLGGKAPAVRTLDDIVALYSAPDAELPELDGEPPEGVRTITFEAGPIPGSRMADTPLTLTPEQTAAIAKGLGLEPKDLAPDKLLAAIETATKAAETSAAEKSKTELETARKALAAAEAKIKELDTADGPKPDAATAKLVEELRGELKTFAERAEAGEKAAEELRVMQRETLLDNAIRGGKLEPAMRDKYAKLFDASPELTRETITALPKRDDLFKTFGADGADITGKAPDDEPTPEQAEIDAHVKALNASMGIRSAETAGAAA